MRNPLVSVVITTYNRAPLLKNTLESIFTQDFQDYEVIVVDDGADYETRDMCALVQLDDYPLRYFKRQRDPSNHYSNPAIPNNIGVRKARGEIIILQNAECRHVGEVMAQFVSKSQRYNAVFAAVEALTPTRGHEQWYVHSVFNPRPFFFCGAIWRDTFVDLGGFDENFRGYGYDDNQLADRLKAGGIEFVFDDTIKVQHQWHPISYRLGEPNNAFNLAYYTEWKRRFDLGETGLIVNEGKEWGKL